MNAFGLAVLFVLGTAIGTGLLLENGFARQADDSFARSSVRVGEGGSIEHRDFSGK